MRSTTQEIKERREQILLLLSKSFNHSLSVDELATHFDVSNMTIRRDLSDLEDLQLLNRFHGGATLNNATEIEEHPTNLYAEKIKEAVAKEAANLITNNATVFINSSTTALNALDYLKDHQLNIISNNLNIIQKEVNAQSNVILPGGEIRSPRKILTGDLTIEALNNTRANFSIMGCSGLDIENGISTNNFHEARINEYMINNTTGTNILVADSRKIGKITNFFVVDLDKIDVLITDTFADTQKVQQIEDMGIRVIQASLDSLK